MKSSLECVVARKQGDHRRVNIITLCNPSLPINITDLEEVIEQIGRPVICVGDFKAPRAVGAANGKRWVRELSHTNSDRCHKLHVWLL